MSNTFESCVEKFNVLFFFLNIYLYHSDMVQNSGLCEESCHARKCDKLSDVFNYLNVRH